MFFRKLHPLHTTQVGVQIIHLNSGVFFSKYTLPWGVLFKVHSASEQVDLIWVAVPGRFVDHLKGSDILQNYHANQKNRMA